jgi:succinate-semialdehyde dehydrogenase / glutarate-semialdehyde dehydrogenase
MVVAKQNGTPADVEQIPVTNPITEERIGEVANTPPEGVQAAVERARDAQVYWSALSVEERARILRKWGDLIWQDQQNAVRIIREETGKNDTGAFIEVLGIDSTVTYYTNQASKLLKPKKRTPAIPLLQWGRVYYKPYGVVGFITPWNYPFLLAMIDLIPALIAGNTAVIKPSEITPYSTLYAVEMLYKAGVPKDAVQVVTGKGETGAALVDYVDYVCFTGSTATGRKVAMQAAERLIPYSLELGGKDALLVLEDANVELTAAGVFMGACENAGQMCTSIERVYVEDGIYDRFVERVRHYADELTVSPGDGFDVHVGSLTNERELLRAEEHIRDAIDKGAELISGGKRRPDLGPLFFEPAVLVNVDHSMLVMNEETFGPLIPIMRVQNVDEAVRLANDSPYGLSGSVWTQDLQKGEMIANRLNTGDVTVNRTSAVPASPSMPWGGQKDSGIGRRGGAEGLMRFVTAQSIVVDRQIGAEPALSLLDPTTLTVLKILRRVRRVLPFV